MPAVLLLLSCLKECLWENGCSLAVCELAKRELPYGVEYLLT